MLGNHMQFRCGLLSLVQQQLVADPRKGAVRLVFNAAVSSRYSGSPSRTRQRFRRILLSHAGQHNAAHCFFSREGRNCNGSKEAAPSWRRPQS